MDKNYKPPSVRKRCNSYPPFGEVVTSIFLETKQPIYRIPKCNVLTTCTIHESLHGTIYKGKFGDKTVAIKSFSQFRRSHKCMIDIITENFKVRKIHRNNLLNVFGYIIDVQDSLPKVSIVMEYCKYGYLRNVLDTQRELTLETRVDLIIDAAYALMCYYHYKPVYRFISTNCFMMTENYRLKLICYGLEKTIVIPYKKGVKQSVYMSPKIINDVFSPFTKEDDVYSFGIVMWEIITGMRPFNSKTAKEIYNMIKNGFKLSIDKSYPFVLRQLISSSLDQNPKNRPTIVDIFNKLTYYKYDK
ncbi:Tyrosine protein kinase-like protein [Eptesipox virus]|uniref:Tyrosine protein kinase-like protein n=1 Tax=Eptesipox virus TaxID=1329402 RepID=A0A220T672_9POXV|nr:Tyrosine protein kinase-like protein [Eptesipox virus]YP_009408137.1 Tyrosine protein kinase-like protein [Eptesipox virus]ASK51207.1 Tyrosine protein kinase-like protein [Eptesipox virus]ASK51387.1 Tyrosine protein kinase-like protein [Eptesipox virus]WAH70965.1 tyrosine protein kinase-like protein [Eptesipox virus]WAH71145.1 tyrosine protein kinase-like protein [Eptesipox virus]